MAEVVEQMSFAARGPWLIERWHLDALDDILEQQRRRIAASKEASIKQAVEEEIESYMQDPILKPQSMEDLHRLRIQLKHVILDQYHLIRDRDNVEIDIGGTKRLSVHSFAEAAQHLTAKEQALGFEARLEHDEIVCKVELIPGTGLLHIAAYPASVVEVQQFYAAMRDWARTVQPTPLQRLWCQLGGYTWLVCLFTLPLIFAALNFVDNRPPKILAALAHQLKAPEWPGIVLVIGLAMCLILAFPPPHALLGIGPGQAQITHWRQRMDNAGHALSGFLILSLLALLVPLVVGHLF